MRTLLIDNYDSFTFNLVHLIHMSMGDEKVEVVVKRNDSVECDWIESFKPTNIIISPGPGSPNESGISMSAVKKFHTSTPILGVCLGHQVIAQVFGASIIRAPLPIHGKTSIITHSAKNTFYGCPSPVTAARYHSLIIDPSTLPECLEVTAKTDDDLIMGIRHKQYPVFGVQFHPESFMTPHGGKIMSNFLSLPFNEN